MQGLYRFICIVSSIKWKNIFRPYFAFLPRINQAIGGKFRQSHDVVLLGKLGDKLLFRHSEMKCGKMNKVLLICRLFGRVNFANSWID